MHKHGSLFFHLLFGEKGVKRTILSLFLGKRVYMHYKPKLEKVMEQMILITEVADLGNAVDDFEFQKVDNPNEEAAKPSKNISFRTSKRKTRFRTQQDKFTCRLYQNRTCSPNQN